MKVQSLRELRDEMRAVAQGRQAAPKDAASPSFESAEALLRLLNSENRALLALIDSAHPQSLAELAKLSGRAESNLSRTLSKLEAMGVVRLVEGPGRAKAVELVVRKLVVEIDVRRSDDQIAVTNA